MISCPLCDCFRFPTSDIVFDTYLNHELMAGLNLPDIKRAAEELYSARQGKHDVTTHDTTTHLGSWRKYCDMSGKQI